MMDKIAVEQFLNELRKQLRIWVASLNRGTATTVAELIEAYDLAHSPLGYSVRTRSHDHRPFRSTSARKTKE